MTHIQNKYGTLNPITHETEFYTEKDEVTKKWK